MPTKKTTVKEPVTEEKIGHSEFYRAARRVLLAGIGAMALAQDEIEDFVNKLVERGEIAEKDGKGLLREIMDKRKKRMGRMEEEFNRRMQKFLEHWDVPTKKDLDTLNEKITNLTRKIDELKKS